MKILLCSYVFAPHIGGIETVSRVLAGQFARLGATVTVATETPAAGQAGPGQQDKPDRPDGPDANAHDRYEIVRRPGPRKLRKLALQSDLVFQSNISLRLLLPVLFCGKPIVIAHHGPLRRPDGSRGWPEYCKLAVVPFCRNLAISRAVAAWLPVKAKVLANPFEAGEFTFSNLPPRNSDRGGDLDDNRTPEREKDIVFLGRLVPEKGCDLALSALAHLKAEGIRPSLTVIGDGPELPALKQLSAELGIAGQVEFRGAMTAGRGREAARHKIMLIPSRYAEPFGVVALEGLAAGCALAASNAGGLPEAAGDCGLLFPMNNVPAIAAALKKLLTDAPLRERLIAGREPHLERFQPERAARNYLDFFASVLDEVCGKKDFERARL